MEYIIIKSEFLRKNEDVDSFSQKVRNYLDEGWELGGELTALSDKGSDFLVQALTRNQAIEVKEEAAKRGISLRKFFEEMSALYKEKKNT